MAYLCLFFCFLGIIPDGDVGWWVGTSRWMGVAGVEVWAPVSSGNVSGFLTPALMLHFRYFFALSPASPARLPLRPSVFSSPKFAVYEASLALVSELSFLNPFYSHKSFKRQNRWR